MKKCLCCSIISVLFVCVLFSDVFAAEKVIELTFTAFHPAAHKMSQILAEWGKEVEKRTNNRVKVSFYPAATLTPANQTYDSVARGIADVGYSVLAYTRGKFPLSEVLDLPLGWKSGLIATRAATAFYKKFQPKEFDETKVMWLDCHGGGVLATAKKPVRTLADIKGLKVRSTGLSAKWVQALGGAPVGMPFTEVYDALSKGVADGVTCPWESLDGWKVSEVTKYVTQGASIAYDTGMFVVMNKSRWNSLPGDIKSIIEKINDEWVDRQGQVWVDADKAGKEVFAKKNGLVITLSKEEDARWAKLVQPTLDEYVKGAKAKGLPGAEALKFVQDYLKANPQ